MDIQQLKPGDVVKHVKSGMEYVVLSTHHNEDTNTDWVFAGNEVVVDNPNEWQFVPSASLPIGCDITFKSADEINQNIDEVTTDG